MDIRLPEPADVGDAHWPHGPLPYDTYLTIHERSMQRLEDEGVVIENTLSIRNVRDSEPGTVIVSGELRCRFRVFIRVNTVLSVRYRRGLPYVQGDSYTYHAWIAPSGRTIIRYDNAHESEGLHCHLTDSGTGEELILPVPRGRLPTLEAFVRIADRLVREAQP